MFRGKLRKEVFDVEQSKNLGSSQRVYGWTHRQISQKEECESEDHLQLKI